MENMVQITETQAYVIKRLIEDILDVDSRARCSDKYFRSHFIDMAKVCISTGAYAEIKRALEGGGKTWN